MDGLLPRWTAILHPTRRTPIGAITGLCLLGLVSGIALGLAFTPTGAFSFLGTLDALFVILIYALVNVACIRFFWRLDAAHRSLKAILLHIVFPLLSTLIIAAIFLAAALSPGPGPLAFIPYVVGVWIVLGVAIVIALRSKFGKDSITS